MRPINIVIFSSGFSEKSGLPVQLKTALEKKNYVCSNWRSLFAGAKDPENIALLPMLLKKIPTFDYAILIAEGHDVTLMKYRDRTIKASTMRDNVLFELGLCSMALGLNKVILLADSDVRLPDDLTGVGHQIAIKKIEYQHTDSAIREAVESTIRHLEDIEKASVLSAQIDEHIQNTRDVLTPVVVGAASSTASGYVSNFILRTFEHWRDGVMFPHEEINVLREIDIRKVVFHIIIPEQYTPEISKITYEYLSQFSILLVPSARFRGAELHYWWEGDILHLIDCPTSIVTSYNTAKMILDMDADDAVDPMANSRFTSKELDLFESTVRHLLSERFIRHTVANFYGHLSEENQEELIQFLKEAVQTIIVERKTF